MMKKYMVYTKEGKNLHGLAIPANSKKAAREYAAGNGEVVAIKDVSKDYYISLDSVTQALRIAGFGDDEVAFITRCLDFSGIAQ